MSKDLFQILAGFKQGSYRYVELLDAQVEIGLVEGPGHADQHKGSFSCHMDVCRNGTGLPFVNYLCLWHGSGRLLVVTAC